MEWTNAEKYLYCERMRRKEDFILECFDDELIDLVNRYSKRINNVSGIPTRWCSNCLLIRIASIAKDHMTRG